MVFACAGYNKIVVIFRVSSEICSMITSKIQILSAEANELIQLGIRFKLEQMDLFRFTLHTVSNGKDAIDFMRANEVNVFLLDLYIEECDGFSVLTIMKNLKLTVPIIIVSSTDKIAEIRQTINLGAKAFVHKNQDSNLLGQAILSVLSGEKFFSEQTIQTLEIFGSKKVKKSKKQSQFNEKDLLILTYLLNGLTSKEIAHFLFLSPRTIEAHRSKLMRKTETKSMLELAKYVAKNKVKLIGKV